MPKGMCETCWNYGKVCDPTTFFPLICPSCKEKKDGQMRARNAERPMRVMSRTDTWRRRNL